MQECLSFACLASERKTSRKDQRTNEKYLILTRMVRQAFILLMALMGAFSSFSQYTVQFLISSLPAVNLTDSSLFIAGSFNGWNPGNKTYEFQRNENGDFFFVTTLGNGTYEFKVTRGSWDRVECNKDGSAIQNHSFNLRSDTTIRLTIVAWADRFAKRQRVSTATTNVRILDTAFQMPQLKTKRRVWIYLPPDYSTSKKRYPVLYMHDGQNVFDDSTSFAGEWRVDETLDSLGKFKKRMIVVAIDHGGSKRINEYCPYDMEKYGKGEGDLYVDFLVKTLKPFIDKTYRTFANKQNTLIAGSSMGGLISMYAVLKYPNVFGGAGIFSPAFWIGPAIFNDISKKGAAVNSRIYFYCGGQEGDTMEQDMVRAFEEMRKVSQSPMISLVRPEGKHTESVWREEFPLFYLSMMAK
jgi:alpha-glucosidase